MKKVSAIIIDDQENNLDLLEHFLTNYCSALVDIIGKANSLETGISLINELKPELLFLDIELGEGNSFELLDKIEQYKKKVIFITAYSEYAIKAFKYNALDYILKPIQIEELVLSVNKACNEIHADTYTYDKQLELLSDSIDDKDYTFDFIAIPSVNKIDLIKTKDIIYCKSDGRYTIFVLSSGKEMMVTKNLGEYENLLDKEFFFRIHKSYIVNLRHLLNINKAAGNYCEMSNEHSLPIAKRRQDQLYRFLKMK